MPYQYKNGKWVYVPGGATKLPWKTKKTPTPERIEAKRDPYKALRARYSAARPKTADIRQRPSGLSQHAWRRMLGVAGWEERGESLGGTLRGAFQGAMGAFGYQAPVYGGLSPQAQRRVGTVGQAVTGTGAITGTAAPAGFDWSQLGWEQGREGPLYEQYKPRLTAAWLAKNQPTMNIGPMTVANPYYQPPIEWPEAGYGGYGGYGGGGGGGWGGWGDGGGYYSSPTRRRGTGSVGRISPVFERRGRPEVMGRVNWRI